MVSISIPPASSMRYCAMTRSHKLRPHGPSGRGGDGPAASGPTLVWLVAKLAPQPPRHPSAGWPAVTAAWGPHLQGGRYAPLSRFAFGSANTRLLSDCDGLGLIS